MTDGTQESQPQEPFAPSLTVAELPSVDHMFNQGMLNLILDRAFGGMPEGVPRTRPGIGLFTNLVRLTDKSLREYDAARFELIDYIKGRDSTPRYGLRTSPYVRAIDHMENAISALARGIQSRDRLQALDFGRQTPKIPRNVREDVFKIRHMIEHADERLTKASESGGRKRFADGEPYALRLENRAAIIGDWMIEYIDVVAAITALYEYIELLRGIKTAGPSHPQTVTRTSVIQIGTAPDSPPGSPFQGTDLLWEISRHSVSH